MEVRLVRMDSLWRVVNYANPENVTRIAAGMRRDRWQGWPLLIEEDLDGCFSAWTGTHRILGARNSRTGRGSLPPSRVIRRRESQDHLDRLPGTEGYPSVWEAVTNPANGGDRHDHQRLAGLQRLGFAATALEEIAAQAG